jgi:hypothetical protein
MSASVMRELAEEFERQAEWRREKAQQYPRDNRSAEAAARFDRLAKSVADCPPAVAEAAWGLFESVPDSEAWQQMMTEVGFWYFPETAEEFCRDFISKQTTGAR